MKFRNILKEVIKDEINYLLNEDFKSQEMKYVNQIKALAILAEYSGENDIILELQKELKKNNNFVPTDKQCVYIIENKGNTRIHITDPEGLVKRYLKDFKEISTKRIKEAKDYLYGVNVAENDDRYDIDKYKTFKEVETLVDYVAGKRPVGSSNFEDIEVDGKPVFVNDDVEVYYADTPRACIEYKGKKPYSWCVSRSSADNMFYNYRLGGYDPAFYFVKRIKPTKKEFSLWGIGKLAFSGKWQDKYHFFVVQVQKNVNIGNTNNKYYIVTSANNDGDKPMSWNEIVENAPELKGLQEVFQPKPLTEKEREKINKYKNGLSDEEFNKLPYKEKDFYMAVYVKMNKPLTDNQFNALSEDLKNKYIGFGVGLSDEQFEMIKNNKNLVKRYAEISQRKYDAFLESNNKEQFEFKNSELNFIDIFKDIEKFKKLDGFYYYTFFKSNSSPDELIDKIINIKGNELDSDGIANLLRFSSNPDDFAKMIINHMGDKLDKYDLSILLKNCRNIDKIIRMIGKDRVSNLIQDFQLNDFDRMLNNSKMPDELIKMIINIKGEALSYEIVMLIKYSKNPYEISREIIKIKGDASYTDGMMTTTFIIHYLLKYAKYPEETVKLIGENEVYNYIINLDSEDISRLLHFSENHDELVKMIIKVKGDTINWTDIPPLIINSENREQTIKLLLQLGIPKRDIDYAIEDGDIT